MDADPDREPHRGKGSDQCQSAADGALGTVEND
jgi:hypothetical protein